MKKRIPADLRPVLIERVRELNADRCPDSEIGRLLGYSPATICHLRAEAKIPAVPSKYTPRGKAFKAERVCPTCTSPVDVVLGGLIEPHKAFFGRIGRGQINGHLIPVAENCPASGQHYKTLAKEMSCAA